MKVKFILEAEIESQFEAIVDAKNDGDYWSSLLQERLNYWRRASQDMSAFKDFIVTPTPSVGKTWNSLTEEQQNFLIRLQIEDIQEDPRDYAINVLQNLPDEEMSELCSMADVFPDG